MATVTRPERTWDGRATRQRVRHPLRRLRGGIRTYVTLEALGIIALFLALWFWISLILDYGIFQLSGIDWVEVLPWAARGTLLAALAGGLLLIVASKMLLRLLRELSDQSLALVLERRYPDELGDCLITAVELADAQMGARYGYSQAMIEETIRDAAERVDRLPVGDVFNWRRLRLLGLRVAVLTIVVYVVGGAGYCLVRHRSVGDFMARFNNVAAIWFERNILLANTIWPRKALLELIDFPSAGELRVGRDSPPPTLRARAIKWVVADAKAPQGWRALCCRDLDENILGEAIPDVANAPDWQYVTVDEIELALSKSENGLASNSQKQQLTDLLAWLEERVNSPRMERVIRRLVVPEKVTVYYRGQTTQSEQTLKKQTDNEYSGSLTDLKESVRFTVRGEDYYTPYKNITLVPPPGLVELTRDEEQPAYIHERRPPGADRRLLQHKKHYFRDLPVSLSGNASRIEVPAGTNVVLKGRADKELRRRDGVVIRPREGSGVIRAAIRTEGSSFQARFENVTGTLDFVLELSDTDNVISLRPVMIKAADDAPPEVDVQLEYIRKTSEGYKVTPLADIPFSGKARDDHGLEKIDYVYELTALDGQSQPAVATAVSAFSFLPNFPADVLSLGCLVNLASLSRYVSERPTRPAEHVAVTAFTKQLRNNAERTPAEGAEPGSENSAAKGFIKDFTFDPEDKDAAFGVEALGLLAKDERQTQPRYRMRLSLTAEDNNVETGPGVSTSKEKFTVLIVSENELLLEIAKEEEGLHGKLDDTINKLKDARGKLEVISQELPNLKANEFSPMARRAEEISEALTKGWDSTSEISKDYARILRELRINRVNPNFIEKIDNTIVRPLTKVTDSDGEFDRAEKSMQAFLQVLEEKKQDPAKAEQARQDLEQLISRLKSVLDNMGRLITINKLIEQLSQLIKAETDAYERYKELNEKLQEELLDKALSPDDKKP